MSENSVSDEERIKVESICKTYLGGVWSEVNETDITIEPIADGFVNKLFLCFLPKHIKTKYNRIVVRIVDYQLLKEFYNLQHVIVISLYLSLKGISPKILCIFDSGTINEYIESRYFNASDDLNDEIVGQLAEKVAYFHSLDVPIPKDSTTYTNEGIFNKWFNQELRKSYVEGVVRKEIEKNQYPVLSKLDFIEELKWLLKTIEDLKSPLVLSHNDLNRRNILIREGEGSPPEMFLIDFDWTNYNYRGVDFGQYFACFGQKEVDFGLIDFPSDERMSVFIDAYVKRMNQLFGNQYSKQDINSKERLIKESKVFALMAFIKDIIYCIWVATVEGKVEILAKAEQRLKCYNDLKNKMLEQYLDLKIE